MQEQALKLIGAKLEASIGIEGKFSEEGLIAMSSGDDMMNALAKAIVGKISNTDSAENIWKRMAEKTKHQSSTRFTEDPGIPQVEILPLQKEPAFTQDQMIVVEITKFQGKRRIVERIEGSEEEVRKILQKTNAKAQLLLF